MSTTETDSTTEQTPTQRGEYWKAQITHATSLFKTWSDRVDKIVDRYRDDRDGAARLRSRYNILWSNVQVLKPSLYGRQAKPEVARRFMDADPVARMASTILERVLDYEISQFPDFHTSMDSGVEDRLLGGRGTCWIRWEPPAEPAEIQLENEVDSRREAHSPIDYVYWKDFLHSPARIWDEVWWVARAAYLTEKEGVDRFGEQFYLVPLTHAEEDYSKRKSDKASDNFVQKAKVWEIWDKRAKTVCWVAEGYAPALDERDDPLQLDGFFPCPKPLYATTTSGSLIPVPDYVEYQDQAEELDSVTGRLTRLVKAAKVIGVFDSSQKELSRMLAEGIDNKLFGVSNWGGLTEKGGLKGAMELMDISVIIQAIATLQAQREAIINTIYQISGISDIMRGSTKAEETLGAQQLKANFGTLRLRVSQTDVARYASDIFRLKAQIICKFYPPEMLVQMSSIAATTEAQQNSELVPAAIQMLSSTPLRDFHISVESDSLAQIDDDAEREAANAAVMALGNLLKESLPILQAAPEFMPAIRESTLFLMRRYRAGRELESSFEQSFAAVAQAAAQPKGPTKEQIEAQSQAQIAQVQAQAQAQAAQVKAAADAQAQTMKLQAEGQLEQMKQRMEAAAREHEAQLKTVSEANDREFEWKKAQLDAETKRIIAAESNATSIRTAQISAGKGDAEDPGSLATNSSVTAAANELAVRFESMIPEPKHAELAAAISGINSTISQLALLLKTPEPAAPVVLHAPPNGQSPFALSGDASNPSPSPNAAAPAVMRRVPIRGADGRMSAVILHYSDGSTKRLNLVRDEKGRMAELVAAD